MPNTHLCIPEPIALYLNEKVFPSGGRANISEKRVTYWLELGQRYQSWYYSLLKYGPVLTLASQPPCTGIFESAKRCPFNRTRKLSPSTSQS